MLRAGLIIWLMAGPAGDAVAAEARKVEHRYGAFIEAMDSAAHRPPNMAVTVFSSDAVLFEHVRGPRREGVDDVLTSDTPFYVASITKSFLGVLAVELDRRGALSLDATLAEALPDLRPPMGVDPNAVTMRSLLSHQHRIDADMVVERTAYVGVDPGYDVVEAMSASASRSDKPFDYDNEGYLLYAAALERATGRTWRAWLEEVIHTPLGLAETRTLLASDEIDSVAWGHRYANAARAGWIAVPPKRTPVLHPAGGHFMSLKDARRWIRLHMRPRGPLAAAFTKVRQAEYVFPQGAGDRYFEMICTGYALGWRLCDHSGEKIVYHGGSYTGAFAFFAFAPERDLGVAVYVGSDHHGFVAGVFTMLQAFDTFLDAPESVDRAAARAERFRGALGRRERGLATARERALIALFNPWVPTPSEEAAFLGPYAHPVLGSLQLEKSGEGYRLVNGSRSARLQPLRPGHFAAFDGGLAPPTAAVWSPDETGAAVVEWNGVSFLRDEDP